MKGAGGWGAGREGKGREAIEARVDERGKGEKEPGLLTREE